MGFFNFVIGAAYIFLGVMEWQEKRERARNGGHLKDCPRATARDNSDDDVGDAGRGQSVGRNGADPRG